MSLGIPYSFLSRSTQPILRWQIFYMKDTKCLWMPVICDPKWSWYRISEEEEEEEEFASVQYDDDEEEEEKFSIIHNNKLLTRKDTLDPYRVRRSRPHGWTHGLRNVGENQTQAASLPGQKKRKKQELNLLPCTPLFYSVVYSIVQRESGTWWRYQCHLRP